MILPAFHLPLRRRSQSDELTTDQGDKGVGEGEVIEAEGSGSNETRFRIKHRYLPILSGLTAPFAVLLDVGICLIRIWSVI